MRTPSHLPILVALTVAAITLGAANTAMAMAPSPAPLIVIDPGHGGRYSNANANGLREKNSNLAIALELRRQLLVRGYRVQMTRTTDRAVQLADGRTWNYSFSQNRWHYRKDGRTGLYTGIPKDDLQARARIANQAGADLFISIHANGSVSRRSRGTETWFSRRDKLGSSPASYVHQDLVGHTGLKARGIFSADFYVLRWANMPSVLVETAFISNRADAWLLKQRWFRRRVATGIASGVDRWMATEPYRKIYPRVSGSGAATLSAGVSAADFPYGAPLAVIAPADQAADLPGVSGLAVSLGGPLLFNDESVISTPTAAELARLAPQLLLLAGLDGSFDETMVASLAQASGLPTTSVEIISAPDRSTLSVAIATRMGAAESGEVLVVDGANSASKLAAAPISAARKIPVLLAEQGTLPPPAAQRFSASQIQVARYVLVGSSSTVPSALGAGTPTLRLDGADIAQRAAVLNTRYFPVSAAGATRPIVASFESPAGYLIAATRAGRVGQPVVPVGDRTLPVFSREWITNRRSAIGSFTLIDTGTMPYLMDVMLAKADRP